MRTRWIFQHTVMRSYLSVLRTHKEVPVNSRYQPETEHFMIDFQLVESDLEEYLPELFKILAENMTKINPTGNTYEEDYAYWSICNKELLAAKKRKIIIIRYNQVIAGFFMYTVCDATLKMDEIQIAAYYQGKSNIFRLLYQYLFTILPENILYVESYANRKNIKSQQILEHLGLKKVEEKKNGYKYRGTYTDLRKWFTEKPSEK